MLSERLELPAYTLPLQKQISLEKEVSNIISLERFDQNHSQYILKGNHEMEPLLKMLPSVYVLHFIFIIGWIMPSVVSSLNAQNSLYEVITSNSSAESNDNLTKSHSSDCIVENIGLEDIKLINNTKMYIPVYNINMTSSQQLIIINFVKIRVNGTEELKREIFRQCSKGIHCAHGFEIFSNGSAFVYNDLMEPGTFELREGNLLTCANSSNNDDINSIVDEGILLFKRRHSPLILGRIGSSISIVALIAHLITFCLVPILRNLPGYNLASLSLALLLTYSFSLIIQIPGVLGVFCIVSGVLQVNFLLTAFFCMNVLAFDIWRTLKRAMSKMVVCSHNKKKNHFIIYSIYSWGIPLIVTCISVIIDNTEGIPSWIKPHFGRWNICWITNSKAKIIFFTITAVALLLANGFFFVMSAFIIKNNTMKNASDQLKQTARRNFFLYVRLGFMMGLTRLVGIIAIVTNDKIVWIIFDLLNSLQGLFIFLLFTCSRKVFKYIRDKVRARSPQTSATDSKTRRSSSDKPVTKSIFIIST
ncbi:g-protein coupled receptor Mth2 [Nephila pilipes]|uniref:G-protein coupled receptor Mth2 n=1 Tax=Nephila pilipes TaxID=299642 RepID=A0A8X6P572_NEPPI|nr:g-protein coupled receptor Mth2 [Nephila pilipes]